MSQIIGHISQIIGPVIDVYFDTEGQEAEKVLPKIYEALKIKRGDGRDSFFVFSFAVYFYYFLKT